MIVFRSPPPALQRVVFGALAPIARRRGYRATYPQLAHGAGAADFSCGAQPKKVSAAA